jgi:glutamine---fructose-6-phosphate transaminase (isomerizing)
VCGIAGYVGPRSAAPILLDCLQRLEYRGYDSCGIAVLGDNGFFVRRSVSPISTFRDEVLRDHPTGSIGLAHTRWATHGRADLANAHPLVSCDGSILVVHNGVLENAFELRDRLTSQGHRFTSETDSETIPHLLEQALADGRTMDEAIARLPEQLVGSYAIVAMRQGQEELYVLRSGSPLVVGIGDGEYFPASDIPSFLPFAQKVIYLHEDDPFAIGRQGIRRVLAGRGSGAEATAAPLPQPVSLNVDSVSKGSFEHFMIKEIMEQVAAIARLTDSPPPSLAAAADLVRGAPSVKFVGAGTSYHAGLFGQFLFGTVLHRDAESCVASEFEFRAETLRPGSVVIAMSQSGETADTLQAVRFARDRGARVVGLVNSESSSLTRASDVVIPLRSGPELSVAATKSYTSQLVALNLLVEHLSPDPAGVIRTILQARDSLYELTSDSARSYMASLAHSLSRHQHLLLIGRGGNYVTALEAALKIKEVAGLASQAFPGGEMKHGPLALVSDGAPVILFYDRSQVTRAELAASELATRGAAIYSVGPQPLRSSTLHIRVNDAGVATPIAQIVPMQLLAYELAKLRQLDPDHPKNLAKSVTVL